MSSTWELLVQRKSVDEVANRIYCHSRRVHVFDNGMNSVGDGVVELVGFNHLPPDSRELMKESLNVVFTRLRMDDGSFLWSYDHNVEDLEEACYREVKEEINAEIEIIKPLHPMIIWKNPQTGEKMCILLIHYLAKLKNKREIKPIFPIKEIKWIDISDIKNNKYVVAPNIKFLIDKGEIN